ncbi:RsmE family RNA methyltransferase [Aminomonas paucivorans]|uniref:RsmE family RNA methyltransferase n=1 Tax=Aminomonas paucivorans TaxID=81412 RepID=UPI0033268DE8
MSQPRIRLEACTLLGEGRYLLDEAQAHHLTRVLRRYEGALVEGLSGEGRVLLRLRLGAGRVEAEEVERVPESPDLLRVVLVVALLKADQFEPLLRMAAEFGVAEIRLLACERSVPRLESCREEGKLSRWRRILDESTRQSGSLRPPTLHPPVLVRELEEATLPPSRFGAFLAPGTVPLGRCLPVEAAAVAVGPEGDWSDQEVETLRAKGFVPVGLGPRILRASTAAAAACGALRLSWEARKTP